MPHRHFSQLSGHDSIFHNCYHLTEKSQKPTALNAFPCIALATNAPFSCAIFPNIALMLSQFSSSSKIPHIIIDPLHIYTWQTSCNVINFHVSSLVLKICKGSRQRFCLPLPYISNHLYDPPFWTSLLSHSSAISSDSKITSMFISLIFLTLDPCTTELVYLADW